MERRLLVLILASRHLDFLYLIPLLITNNPVVHVIAVHTSVSMKHTLKAPVIPATKCDDDVPCSTSATSTETL